MHDLSERFVGVDRAGDFSDQHEHLYFVATRYSRRGKQIKWVICLTRSMIVQLRKQVADFEEKIFAIMIFKAVNQIFHPGYSIQIDKDYQGRRLRKVKGYVKRVFGVVNYGKAFFADPPLEFLPKEYSKMIRDADQKATRARHKEIKPDETDPNINRLLDIAEEARRKGIF